MRNALVSAFVSSADLEFRPMTLIYELDLYIYVKGHFVLELLSEHTHTHTRAHAHTHTIGRLHSTAAKCQRKSERHSEVRNIRRLRVWRFTGFVDNFLAL